MKPPRHWWQGHIHSWTERGLTPDEQQVSDLQVTNRGQSVIRLSLKACSCGTTTKPYAVISLNYLDGHDVTDIALRRGFLTTRQN